VKKISQKPSYIPVFINLRKRKCIVVGGGPVAFRKVGMLLEGGASVEVISPDFCSDLRKLAGKNKIHLIGREYRPGDLRDPSW